MGRKLTTEEFIEKAKEVHGDKYDYSKVEYTGSKNKATITCPIHGEFKQTPSNHLNNFGCFECGKTATKNSELSNTKQFIEKAKSIHGDKYDYSKVEYKNAHTKVTITCPIHGEFEQMATNHLIGYGCFECGKKNRTKNQILNKNDFIEKTKEVHGDWYDYSKVEYNNTHDKIRIDCPVHGEFIQKVYVHLNGHGCPECASETRGFWNPKFIRKHHQDKLNNPCTLYVLECYSEDESFIKVGITTKTLEERYKDKKDFTYQYDTLYEFHSTLIHCSEIEQEVLQAFKDYQHEPIVIFGGSSECLQYDYKDSILLTLKQIGE